MDRVDASLSSAPSTLYDAARGSSLQLARNATREVFAGRIFVFRQALQEIGSLESLRDASLRGIRSGAGVEAAAAVDKLGFESFHKFVAGDAVKNVLAAATEEHRRLARGTAKRLCSRLFGKCKFYLEDTPNVRFCLPYDCTRPISDIDAFQFSGKITPHGPHQDSWYYCPRNCVDIWIALGRVRKGNGLSIFPEAFGRVVPSDARGVVNRSEFFGKPVNFDLEPGDVLVFSGEHLHASELNSTNETRHVVSFRITFEKPDFIGNSPYRYNYSSVVPHGGPVARASEWIQTLLRKGARAASARLGFLNQSRWIATTSELQQRHRSLPRPAEVQLRRSGRAKSLIEATKSKCSVRAGDGRVFVIQRYCPHEGADLSLGHVEGSTLYCPWHNLPFDLETGFWPCRSIRRLRTYR